MIERVAVMPIGNTSLESWGDLLGGWGEFFAMREEVPSAESSDRVHRGWQKCQETNGTVLLTMMVRKMPICRYAIFPCRKKGILVCLLVVLDSVLGMKRPIYHISFNLSSSVKVRITVPTFLIRE